VFVAWIGDRAAHEGHHDQRELADLEAPKKGRLKKSTADYIAEHRTELAQKREHHDYLGESLDPTWDVETARLDALGGREQRVAG
jgi:hypothetical protein